MPASVSPDLIVYVEAPDAWMAPFPSTNGSGSFAGNVAVGTLLSFWAVPDEPPPHAASRSAGAHAQQMMTQSRLRSRTSPPVRKWNRDDRTPAG
jgi:hypothetical protein